jgi:hypothetical protein
MKPPVAAAVIGVFHVGPADVVAGFPVSCDRTDSDLDSDSTIDHNGE